jgi:hypothetical protein
MRPGLDIASLLPVVPQGLVDYANAVQDRASSMESTLYNKSDIYHGLKDMVTAPGKAWTGELDPESPEGIQQAVNFGMGIMGGGGATSVAAGARLAPGELGATAWHGSPHLFDAFKNEAIGTGEGAQAYGHGLQVNGTNDIIHNKLNISEARNDNPIRPEQPIDGKIKTDYEGRTIGAEYVVGRRYEDTPQSPLTYNEAMDAATKIGAISSEAQNLGRSLGKFIKSSDANGNTTRNIILKTGLGDKSGDVYSHEFSHLLDDIAFGGVETAGAKKEFADVYSELNKPYRGGKPFTAKDAGYKGADIEKEHIAESIRFYLQNPEAMKEMAPNAARKIRDAFNSNPNINKIVQFNSVAGAVGLGAIGGQENNPDDIRILERNGQPTGAKSWKEDK